MPSGGGRLYSGGFFYTPRSSDKQPSFKFDGQFVASLLEISWPYEINFAAYDLANTALGVDPLHFLDSHLL